MERHHRRINSTKRRKLIAAYKLPGAPGTHAALPLDTEDGCNAAVVNNGVISFADGLSGLNREYIRKSYLLASSYASCAETDGEVMMVLVTYSSHGVSKHVGLPFLEWDSSSFEAFSGQTCLVLNTSVVNEKTIRLMRESAGDKVQLAIAKYRI